MLYEISVHFVEEDSARRQASFSDGICLYLLVGPFPLFCLIHCPRDSSLHGPVSQWIDPFFQLSSCPLSQLYPNIDFYPAKAYCVNLLWISTEQYQSSSARKIIPAWQIYFFDKIWLSNNTLLQLLLIYLFIADRALRNTQISFHVVFIFLLPKPSWLILRDCSALGSSVYSSLSNSHFTQLQEFSIQKCIYFLSSKTAVFSNINFVISLFVGLTLPSWRLEFHILTRIHLFLPIDPFGQYVQKSNRHFLIVTSRASIFTSCPFIWTQP